MTTQQQREPAQRPGERLYQTVFEQSHHATWVLSADGAILAANRRARGLMASGEEWVGADAADAAFPRATPAARAALAIALDSVEPGAPARIVVEDTDVAGKRRTHEVTVRRATSVAGEPLFLVLEARDVGEIRRIAEEAQAARLAAESADRAKAAFLARMSHEMRTPLHAVLGFARLLRDRDAGESAETREALEQIESAGERLLALVNDVLELARIESGGLEVADVPVDLRALLDGLARGFAGRAAQKGLELALRLDPRLPAWVRLDAPKLTRLLGDLLDNGLKFTASGRVELAAEWQPEGRLDRVALVVSDTGAGIAEGELSRLLTPFESGRGAHSGTGLGLALARRLVLLMGGEFRIDSRIGEGTRVRLELPAPVIPGVDSPPSPVEPLPVPVVAAPLAGLAALSEELRGELRRAAEEADWGRLEEAVGRAIESDPELASFLNPVLDRFDYATLLAGLGAQPAAASSASSTPISRRLPNGAIGSSRTSSSASRGRENR